MTITKNNAWVYPEAYEKAVRDAYLAEKDGYVKVPDWFPVPTEGYEYKIFGEAFAYMKPKPKLRHILWYKSRNQWFHKWQMKRLAKKLLRN